MGCLGTGKLLFQPKNFSRIPRGKALWESTAIGNSWETSQQPFRFATMSVQIKSSITSTSVEKKKSFELNLTIDRGGVHLKVRQRCFQKDPRREKGTVSDHKEGMQDWISFELRWRWNDDQSQTSFSIPQDKQEKYSKILTCSTKMVTLLGGSCSIPLVVWCSASQVIPNYHNESSK